LGTGGRSILVSDDASRGSRQLESSIEGALANMKLARLAIVILAALAVTAIVSSTASAAPEFKVTGTAKGAVTLVLNYVERTGRLLTRCRHGFNIETLLPPTRIDIDLFLTGCRDIRHPAKEGEAEAECPIKSTNTSVPELIVTNTLRGLLGSVKAAEAATLVGLLVEPSSGKVITTLAATEAKCEAEETAVTGNVAGEVLPVGVSQSTGKYLFLPAATGKEEISEIVVPSGTVKPKLTAYSESTNLELEDEVKYEASVEVT
jgi:hypothetical protein